MQAMKNRSEMVNMQKEQLGLQRDAAKNKAEQARHVSQMAQEGLKTLDVDNDGNLSIQERNRAMLLRLAAQSGDPSYIKAAGEAIKQQAPTTLERNLQAAGFAPGSEEYQSAMLDAVMKPQVSVDMSTQKALGADAVKWRNSSGEAANPMLTVEQATAMGYTPRSNDEIKAIEATGQMADTMGSMVNWGIGSEGSLFPPADKGAFDRMGSGLQAKWRAMTEDPNHPALVQYTKTKDATLSSLARMVGQVGQLTDRDVALVGGLWPTPGYTPEPIAARQFISMAALLKGKGLTDENLMNAGFPEWVVKGQMPKANQYDEPLPGRN